MDDYFSDTGRPLQLRALLKASALLVLQEPAAGVHPLLLLHLQVGGS